MPKASDIPACPQQPDARSSGQIVSEYRIGLVTPLFGGGAEAGKTDQDLPIRGTSIRGHLRYWWRTVKGRHLAAGMWQREEEVFGSTEFASPLRIRVLDVPRVERVDPTYGDRFGPIAYALFSAVENRQEVIKEGGEFRIQLEWADVLELRRRREGQNALRRRDGKPLLSSQIDDIGGDIAAAIQAWCAFGGLGSRTRRGCGALWCRELGAKLPEVDGTILLAAPRTNAIDAWKEALKTYRDFRQSPRGRVHPKIIGSGRTIKVPGRSHWPEADSIRKITGSALRPSSAASSSGVPPDEDTHDHSVPLLRPELLPAFPRAILGLPINFHFADGPGKGRPGQRDKDPQDVKLIPIASDDTDGDRMSSPIITRPLWVDGAWRPGLIVLKQHLPRGLRVRLIGKRARADGRDLSYTLPPKHVVDSSLGAIAPMRGHASALDAFHEFARSRGFEEVTP